MLWKISNMEYLPHNRKDFPMSLKKQKIIIPLDFIKLELMILGQEWKSSNNIIINSYNAIWLNLGFYLLWRGLNLRWKNSQPTKIVGA